ncbi:MAG: NADH:flavin oxidoreductase [Gammaproteobacteria bacterium]|nr:NADH:flavin oxidoreductase [Gammaproteobacteria bacterium]
MWKPRERIKYTVVEDRWPTIKEVETSRLFAPIQIGPMNLDSRTWVPAMVPWRSNENGDVTEDVLAWYERFARGKPGAIVVEATGIRDIPSGPLLRISSDKYLPGLTRLVDTIKTASDGETRVLIQIIDFLQIRRRPDPTKYLNRHLILRPEHYAALALPFEAENESTVRSALLSLSPEELESILNQKEWEDLQYGYRERVTDTHLPHIAQLPEILPQLFSNAAIRAEAAGFDGVELHYAHAYTMASFLSATNNRADGYGNSLEGRLRLPLEVYGAVRAACSKDFVVGCRFLSDEIIDQGTRIEEACSIARALADAGMDFLSVSRGGKFDDAKQPRVGGAVYPYTGPSGYECMPSYISDAQGPFGRNVEPVSLIRELLRLHGLNTPVVLAGGQYGFYQAESLLKENKADIVGFARQALADPDWFLKVKLGLGNQVRLCKYTNYCEGLDQKHKQVTCELWDRENMEQPGIRKSYDGRRRLLAPEWSPPVIDPVTK